LQLAEGGEIWNTYLSTATKAETKIRTFKLLVTPACCKVLLPPVLVVCVSRHCPRVEILSFVFVVRGGIFENFLLGFVGRQDLLGLPFPLKK